MTKQTDKVVIEEQIIDKYGMKGPVEKVFHSGIDPLDDIQIAVASKKRFIEWWKLHTTSYPIRNQKGVVDSGKVIRLTQDGIDVIGATFAVVDSDGTELPFKMNNVDSFVLDMPELHTLKNTPRICKVSGQFGTPRRPMKYMDSLADGPLVEARVVNVYTESTFLNLETSLKSDIESLSITAPFFATFEGLNVNVTHLCLNTTRQHSFKGIHRALNNSTANICSFSVGVDKNYEGGVLAFAMMDPSIEVLPDVAGNPPADFVTSMGVVHESRKQGMNVHDIQELLIDQGLGKYARL